MAVDKQEADLAEAAGILLNVWAFWLYCMTPLLSFLTSHFSRGCDWRQCRELEYSANALGALAFVGFSAEQKLAFLMFSPLWFGFCSPPPPPSSTPVIKIRSICLNGTSLNPSYNPFRKELNLIPIYCMCTVNCTAQILAHKAVVTLHGITVECKMNTAFLHAEARSQSLLRKCIKY